MSLHVLNPCRACAELAEAVKRNRARFPEDFMFRLTRDEVDTLISQNAMSKPGRGGRVNLG